MAGKKEKLYKCSGQVGKHFVLTLTVELEDIWGRKWNSKLAILFHKVILHRVQIITGAKDICAQIDS